MNRKRTFRSGTIITESIWESGPEDIQIESVLNINELRSMGKFLAISSLRLILFVIYFLTFFIWSSFLFAWFYRVKFGLK